MKILVPLSGGKDSQASLLWAIEKYGVENIEAVFCDTKWESPVTYDHIKYLISKTGIKFTRVVSSKYDGMVDLAKQKKMFPSLVKRFCTEELKIYPMIDYILTLTDHIILIEGIRADESKRRSKMNESCRYFKYYFEPYQTNKMIVEELESQYNLSLSQKNRLKKAKQRLELGKNDEKYFTYRKNEVIEWCSKYDDSIWRPFFNSTGDEVIHYSLNRGVDINPLYYKGFKRIGCFPCVGCVQDEIDLIIRHYYGRIKQIADAEDIAGATFFKPDAVPPRYRINKEGIKKPIAPIEAIVRYNKDRKATGDIFKDAPQFQCRSIYNICE